MRRCLTALSFSLSLALALAACSPAGGPTPSGEPEDVARELDRAVEELDLVGAAMAVEFSDGETWGFTSGLSRLETMEAWEPGRSIRIGSVTKTFTAALIFLLIEDGVLTLDDPLEQWVPGYYDGLGVTLRHLLSNTSGIVSYNYVGSFDDTRPWEPQELAQWAVDHEPALRFEPGSEWEYSNTNFVLLGLVIEAATGDSYEGQFEERLTGPMGLTRTYLAGSGDMNPALVDCYERDGSNTTGHADPSFGWAAGAAVSTPEELARWISALYGGELLSAGSLELMTTQQVLSDGTTQDYGLGAFVERDGDDALFGHEGGIGGYITYAFYWQADGIALVAATNTFDTDMRTLAGYGWSALLGL